MKPRILMVSPYNPFVLGPSGSSAWLQNRLESLSRCADVSVVTFADPHQRREILEALGVSAALAPAVPPRRSPASRITQAWGILLGRLSVLARITDIVGALRPLVCALAERERFDLIQVEDVIAGPLIADLPQDPPSLLVLHNLLTAYFARIACYRSTVAQRLAAAIECRWVRRFERRVLSGFPAAVVLTRSEYDQARAMAPALRIHRIPLLVDTDRLLPRPLVPDSPCIAFCGTMSYPPNAEAVLRLAASILPLVRARFPGLKCYVVGRNPTAEVRACADPRVIVTGEVDEVAPYLLRADVIVVPLLTGAGMRTKILEAWALARPVVSTSLGADGLEYQDGENLLIADDDASFAEKVCFLLAHPEAGRQIGRNARATVERVYSRERVWAGWEAVYAELLGEGKVGAGTPVAGRARNHAGR
ncbi:MAG: glycosyltransferase [candidate division NC10 bacterium]|nr:glycosyltransferase [candidate division NC10 bacterium]